MSCRISGEQSARDCWCAQLISSCVLCNCRVPNQVSYPTGSTGRKIFPQRKGHKHELASLCMARACTRVQPSALSTCRAPPQLHLMPFISSHLPPFLLSFPPIPPSSDPVSPVRRVHPVPPQQSGQVFSGHRHGLGPLRAQVSTGGFRDTTALPSCSALSRLLS